MVLLGKSHVLAGIEIFIAMYSRVRNGPRIRYMQSEVALVIDFGDTVENEPSLRKEFSQTIFLLGWNPLLGGSPAE